MNNPPKTFFEKEVERISDSLPLQKYHYVKARQSRAFMERYYSENIGLDKLAAAAFMSRFHYIRIFQQVYGMTPRQYLRDLRLSKAKELLARGHSATSVCFDVGYESFPTFSTAFKRGTGYTPKKFQQLNKSNPE